MEIASLALMGLGGVLSLVTGIWLIVVAFSTSVIWGLAYLFVPFASLVFIVMNWGKAGKLFLLSLLGAGLMVGGIAISPDMQRACKEAMEQSKSQEAVPASRTSDAPAAQ